jgi:hypothetical protein
MMSELLPNWNNPILAMLLNPEALVFGNPIAFIHQESRTVSMTRAGSQNETLMPTVGLAPKRSSSY